MRSCTELPAGSTCNDFYSSYSSGISGKRYRECTNPSLEPTIWCIDCPGTYTCVPTDMVMTDPSSLCP